jgi:hypothetical protein
MRLFEDEPLADPTATILADNLIDLAMDARAQRLDDAVRLAEAAA